MYSRISGKSKDKKYEYILYIQATQDTSMPIRVWGSHYLGPEDLVRHHLELLYFPLYAGVVLLNSTAHPYSYFTSYVKLRKLRPCLLSSFILKIRILNKSCRFYIINAVNGLW
jgi:hypothetical protein